MKSNITIELLKLDHAQDLYLLTDSNRAYLKEWLPWLDQIQSVDDTTKFIESTIEVSSSGGAPNFAILSEGAICGVAGFHEINKQHRIGSIGYWLAQKYTGKGIVTQVVKELLRIGFGEFKLNKIEIQWPIELNKIKIQWPIQINTIKIQWLIQLNKIKIQWLIQLFRIEIQWLIRLNKKNKVTHTAK